MYNPNQAYNRGFPFHTRATELLWRAGARAAGDASAGRDDPLAKVKACVDRINERLSLLSAFSGDLVDALDALEGFDEARVLRPPQNRATRPVAPSLLRDEGAISRSEGVSEPRDPLRRRPPSHDSIKDKGRHDANQEACKEGLRGDVGTAHGDTRRKRPRKKEHDDRTPKDRAASHQSEGSTSDENLDPGDSYGAETKEL